VRASENEIGGWNRMEDLFKILV